MRFHELLRSLRPDLFIVAGFPEIFGPKLLRIPRLGCLNIHGSLLPQYRGPQPTAQVLLRGEPFTGVTIHFIDEGIDSGDIVLQDVVPILENDTVYSLANRQYSLGVEMLIDALERLATGRLQRRPQDEKRASYYGRLGPADGVIDWSKPAAEIKNLVRLHPWLTPTTSFQGRTIFVSRVVEDATQTYAGRTGELEGDGIPRGLPQPGQILFRQNKKPVIACGDGRLRLEEYSVKSRNPFVRRRVRRRLRPPERLGS